MSDFRAILIAGPTAAGKSALAITLAQEHNGTIINADSMQVYADLAILTARPGGEDLGRAPHVLFGHVSGAEAYSVGRWLADAEAAIRACWDAGGMPIVVGGTGLYFKALLAGLSPVPPIPEEVRSHWRGEASRLGAPALHAVLADRDPDTARKLRPSDPQRVTRALEVFDATGRGLSAWQSVSGRSVLVEAETRRLVVWPERGVLHERADRRFDEMMAAGAMDEALSLASKEYADELPVMRALGVAPLIAAGRGKVSLDAAVAETKRETRQYIRRQETWLRRNMMAWNRVI